MVFFRTCSDSHIVPACDAVSADWNMLMSGVGAACCLAVNLSACLLFGSPNVNQNPQLKRGKGKKEVIPCQWQSFPLRTHQSNTVWVGVGRSMGTTARVVNRKL